MRTPAPPQRRKTKPAYRIFPVSRISAAGCSRIPTMWRPNDPTREEISNVPGMDPQSKRRRSRRRAWRDGLADQTVVTTLEHVRSYRAFERALVGSVDPRSVIELALVHRLASLLWRLHRASAIETGLFEIQAEFLLARQQDPSRGAGHPGVAANFHSSQWPQKSPWLERTTLSARWRVDVHAPTRCSLAEIPRDRPMFPPPLQCRPD